MRNKTIIEDVIFSNETAAGEEMYEVSPLRGWTEEEGEEIFWSNDRIFALREKTKEFLIA
jgi:hypothetical protein